MSRRLLPLLVLLLCGCFRARVDVELFEKGDGSINVQLALDRSKLPPFLGDPLAGVGTPEDLHRYGGPGIVAWAEPRRGKKDSWETVSLRAYFDDVNALRFLRQRDDGEVAELLRFEYAPKDRPGALVLRHDLGPELAEPMPIPEQPGSRIQPEAIRSAIGMLRPMLGDLQLSLHLKVPGEVQSAPGFHERSGREAILRDGRDPVLKALEERAGVLLDEAAFLAAKPPVVRWKASADRPEDRARHDRGREAAVRWWATQTAKAADSSD